MSQSITVAVEGCCHGELDAIYAAVEEASRSGPKIDILLICGDFESIEQESDLQSIAVPEKYKHMNTFHEYVTGVKVAPVLTVFIGGNHEASNVLQSLYYGGFVAPNIYFLGFAGVVNFGFLRISGLSGICNDAHYRYGHFERPPYDASSLRSVYHIRELEVYRLAHLRDASPTSTVGDKSVKSATDDTKDTTKSHQRQKVDIMMSHDWPRYVYKYGDCDALLRRKPGLAPDIHSDCLGGECLWDIMCQIQPHFWFAAHHHVKFPAIIPWSEPPRLPEAVGTSDGSTAPPPPPLALCAPIGVKTTRFLALDKVLPARPFLQVLTIPQPQYSEPTAHDDSESTPYSLQYDVEWLSIVKNTHSYLRATRHPSVPIPRHLQPMATEAELQTLRERIVSRIGSMDIPNVGSRRIIGEAGGETAHRGNVQTDILLDILEIPHVWTVPAEMPLPTASSRDGERVAHSRSASAVSAPSADANEIDI